MPVTFEDEKATSFGNVAESYDRDAVLVLASAALVIPVGSLL
jgi:hypothetical protein